MEEIYSVANKERNEKYTKKIVKLKQEIQLSVDIDNIDEEQIAIQLYGEIATYTSIICQCNDNHTS